MIENILGNFNRENNTKISITPEALLVLTNCHWPGNVRELENCVARFSTLSQGNVIQSEDIPCQSKNCLSSTLWKYQPQETTITIRPIAALPNQVTLQSQDAESRKPENERDRLISAMEKSGWVQAKAARLLDLTPRQMGYALKKNNIEIKRL